MTFRNIWARWAVATALCSAVVFAMALPADATWSVAAVDPDTGQVGVALASCVPAGILGRPDRPLVPIVILPGRGAAVTQGELNLDAPGRITQLLKANADPRAIVDDLASQSFDSSAQTRQHAVVTAGGAAAFSGNELGPQALDRQASGVSVQGNLLVSDAVVDDALAAYEQASDAGADLAAALTAGLLAGSRAGGDRRCPDQSALFAQLVVAGPDDSAEQPSTLLTVTVDQGDGQNPVELLATAAAEGRTGLLDAGANAAGRSGQVVQIVVLATAVAMVGVGFLVLRRGLGSVRARR